MGYLNDKRVHRDYSKEESKSSVESVRDRKTDTDANIKKRLEIKVCRMKKENENS